MADELHVAHPSPATTTIVDDSHGAVFKPVHLERHMRIYPVLETELTTLALLTHQFTASLAIAGGVFGFLVSIMWDAATSTEPMKRKIGLPLGVICVAAIAGCLVVAKWSREKRKSELEKILSEARVIRGSV
jgi:hypothetical protein